MVVAVVEGEVTRLLPEDTLEEMDEEEEEDAAINNNKHQFSCQQMEKNYKKYTREK